MSDTPDTPRYVPAPVTLGRAQRYFDLLARMGVADALEEARRAEAQARLDAVKGKPSQGLGAVDVPEGAAPVTLDVGTIWGQIVAEGYLVEAGRIVMVRQLPDGTRRDLAPEEATDDLEHPLTADAVEEAFIPFVVASHGLFNALVGYAIGSA
ncbi:MAG: hypothetical protein GVY18_05240 [Bacteroidetes bacterium]|jgi:hypothetical protein|nr:hypothetical protein [Bacteroidota bacterium]